MESPPTFQRPENAGNTGKNVSGMWQDSKGALPKVHKADGNVSRILSINYNENEEPAGENLRVF